MLNYYEKYWETGWEIGHGFALSERKAKLHKALYLCTPGAAVLDAGCGNGEFSQFLADLGYRVTGIDVSVAAIKKAMAAVPNVFFLTASLERELPFADSEFAAVWCTEVVEHLFDVHAALSALNRVLAQSGLLILTTPYHALIKNWAIVLFGFERHFDPYTSHIRFFSRKSLSTCLARAGFAPVLWDGVGRFWPLWMSHFVVARKISDPGPPPSIRG